MKGPGTMAPVGLRGYWQAKMAPELGCKGVRAVGPALHLSLRDKPRLMEAVFLELFSWH